MERANAFVGCKECPTEADVSTVLGRSAEAWSELIEWLEQRHGVSIQEWNSYSVKAGWALKLKLKKRTILYMSPCDGCFRVAFVLGDKALAAAKAACLPKAVAEAILEAPKYPEGTGLRLLVKGSRELGAIRKLAAIKLAN